MTQTPSRTLDLTRDVALLTADLMDIESVSGNEKEVADAVEAALRSLEHLEVVRDGDSIIARTSLGRGERVLLADTWTRCRCRRLKVRAERSPPPGTARCFTDAAPPT